VKVGEDGYALFADASLNPLQGIGIGAYLVVPAALLTNVSRILKQSELFEQPALRRFEGTSSTALEVQTVLWALSEHHRIAAVSVPAKLRVYTDSQCIAGLLKRRSGLTARNFGRRRSDLPLQNAALYRRFYELRDELDFEVTKVNGHARRDSRNAVQEVFSYLDRYVRKALRRWVEERGQE